MARQPVRLSLPDDLHRLVKAEAALRGLTLRAFMEHIVRDYLERKGTK